MKKSSKRIIVSVLTLVLTVVALTTTTFAWFSLSSVSSVNGITGHIEGGEGLEVKLNDGTFMNNLTEKDFETVIKKGFRFSAVTKDSHDGAFTKLALGDDNKLKLGQKTTENIDYIEFTLTFRSQQQGKVNLGSYEFTGTPMEFTPENPYKQTAGSLGDTKDKVITSAANAARISFTNSNSTVAFQAPTSDTNTGGNVLVEHGQWSFLKSKQVVIHKFDGTPIVGLPTDISMLKAYESVTADNKEILDLQTEVTHDNRKYYQEKTTVRIWIEGWDADTYDSVFKSVLNVALSFTKE